MDTLEALSDANESTLKYISEFQERVVDAQRELAATVKVDVPAALPSWLPTPEAANTRGVVEEAFAFRARLLEANRAFALSLLDVWVPVAEKAPAATKKK